MQPGYTICAETVDLEKGMFKKVIREPCSKRRKLNPTSMSNKRSVTYRIKSDSLVDGLHMCQCKKLEDMKKFADSFQKERQSLKVSLCSTAIPSSTCTSYGETSYGGT